MSSKSLEKGRIKKVEKNRNYFRPLDDNFVVEKNFDQGISAKFVLVK